MAWSMVGDGSIGSPSLHIRSFQLSQQPQRRKQAGNAEHVVEMAVSQQQPVESPEAGCASKQLALGTFSAIDEDSVAASVDKKGGMVPLGRRKACRCTEKGQVEHRNWISLSRIIRAVFSLTISSGSCRQPKPDAEPNSR